MYESINVRVRTHGLTAGLNFVVIMKLGSDRINIFLFNLYLVLPMQSRVGLLFRNKCI